MRTFNVCMFMADRSKWRLGWTRKMLGKMKLELCIECTYISIDTLSQKYTHFFSLLSFATNFREFNENVTQQPRLAVPQVKLSEQIYIANLTFILSWCMKIRYSNELLRFLLIRSKFIHKATNFRAINFFRLLFFWYSTENKANLLTNRWPPYE